MKMILQYWILPVLLTCVSSVARLACAAPATGRDGACERALFATGLDWAGTKYKPVFKAVHPAFSPTARAIYFAYEVIGLKIHIEQGPYVDLGMFGNKIRRFYLEYDPTMFLPGTFFRRMFGTKPLRITEAELGNRYSSTTLIDDREGDDLFSIFVPLREGLTKDNYDEGSAQLLISRSTGKVFGYGRRGRSVVTEFLSGCWMELRKNANAHRHGRGVWYNSDPNLPAPTFGVSTRQPTSK